MITINSVTFSYGNRDIFRDYSVTIPDGIVCIRSASGSGKTTLLRLIAGLLKPQSGNVDGVPENVTFMFQEDRLLPWYTALQNVEVVLPKDKKEKARELLRAVELEGREGRYPENLSGGQQRRVALARALAFGGDLLILDEPFKGLDAELTQRLIKLIKSKYTSVIVTSHSEEEINEWGGTVIEL